MRVGVTQRVEYLQNYGEVRDCLDQRWANFFDQLDMTMVPIPNSTPNIEQWLVEMSCDAYVLSGGNDLSSLGNSNSSSKLRDDTEFAILKLAQENSIPVLGICRGFQMMNVYLGGGLKEINGHIGTRHKVKFLPGSDIELDDRIVNSFHKWGIPISSLADTLKPLACDDANNIEAAWHTSLNWAGLMWHPERERSVIPDDVRIVTGLFREVV